MKVQWKPVVRAGLAMGCVLMVGCGGQKEASLDNAAQAHGRSSEAVRRPPSAAYNEAVPIKGIGNLHVVHPFLLRGAAPSDEGIRDLHAAGVRTIIDLRIAPKAVAKERKLVESLGMKFINLPMSGDPPTSSEVATFMSTVSSPASQPVFVHCQHGADRTGTMCGIYRERVDGWSFDKTYHEMRQYGFNPVWIALKRTVQLAAHE